jgi:hypothetical protein
VEKVVYVLWRDPATPVGAWSQALREQAVPELADAGARGLQVNVSDEAVAASVVRLVELEPQMEATVGLWLDSARDAARQVHDRVLGAVPGVTRLAAYAVTESEPLRDPAHDVPAGERTPGFANLAFLRRPAGMPLTAWIDAWHNGHTEVAIATQSTFGYVQNVVVRPLSPDAPAIDGIVEELFPAEALTSLHAFFAAADDDELAANMGRMGRSVARFGADRSLDVVPTSRYVFSRLVPD